MPFGTVFKFLAALWPFLSEMFFAGKTIKQVALENKLLVAVLFALCMSLTLNYISFAKIFEIAVSRRDDNHKKATNKIEPKASEVTEGPPAKKETPEEAQKRHDELLRRLEGLEKK